jgi:two-component system, cell cycle response regulator DivK
MQRILIIEDNEDNRDMLGRRLQRKGFEIAFAVDGEEGVEKVLSETPDLILLDMSLPRMDGWAVARALRSQEIKTPIIALTAHAMQGDREKTIAAGCDDYDTKPVELPRLLEKIETLLGRAA